MPVHDARRLRTTRLIALGIAWLVPVVSGLLHHFDPMYALLGLVYPTTRKAILLLGIGLQVYRIARPTTAPRVYEYVETQGEIGVLGLLIFLDFAIQYSNLGFGGAMLQWGFSVADWLMMLGLFAGRTRVVVDGNTRKVTFGDLIPRTKSFDEIRGLGTITIRHLRNGVQTGTTYRVGLFVGAGAPKPLDIGYSPVEVEQKIRAIMNETGLQVARA